MLFAFCYFRLLCLNVYLLFATFVYGRYCTAFCFAYTSQTSSNENWDHCPATFNWALKQVQEKLPRGTEVPESYRWLQHHAPLATCHKHSQTVQVIMGGTSLLTPKRLVRALRPEIIRRMDHESLWNGDHFRWSDKNMFRPKTDAPGGSGETGKRMPKDALIERIDPF